MTTDSFNVGGQNDRMKVIIQQAERNSKNKKWLVENHQQKEEKEFYDKTGYTLQEGKANKEKMDKINKMTPEQQKKYMLEGD